MQHFYILVAILSVQLPESTHAHGMMLEPISRPSGWRFNPRMPVNYDDNSLNCGGRDVQWNQNGGKCGLCGEPWSGTKYYERPNGILAQELFLTEYTEGQLITVTLRITALYGHKGYHEFLICDIDQTGGVEATQDCLDRTPLADETGATRFTEGTLAPGVYTYFLVLPMGFTCRHCMLQWRWHCGNDWGCDSTGCGQNHGRQQEEFYSCADVAIIPRALLNSTSTYAEKPQPTTTPTTTTTTTTTSTTTQPSTTTTTSTTEETTQTSTTSTTTQPSTTTTNEETTQTSTTSTTTQPSTTTTTTEETTQTSITSTPKSRPSTPRFYYNVIDIFFKNKYQAEHNNGSNKL